MSREDYDIPEVFRRAMEGDWGNREGRRGDGGEGGDGGDGDGRPPLPRRMPVQPFWRNRTFWLITIILVLLLSVNWIVNTYTEWLWFSELTYARVWLKQWGYEVVSFLLFFAIAAAILLGNWHMARRRAIASTPSFNPNILKIPGLNWIITGAALFLTFGFASTASARWEDFLLFFYRVPYGTADPIFNKDISFYLFELPVYEFLQGWLLSILFMVLIGTIVLHTVNYLPDIQRGSWQPLQINALRQHVALLGAVILVIWALGYLFNIYQLLYSARGVVFGASYTDMNASLWALRAQIVFILIAAAAIAANIFRPTLRPALAAGGLWLAVTLLLGGIYPGLLQRYSVEPNELERERPYIEYNIEYTQLAFKLDTVDAREFGAVTDLSRADLADNPEILKNVRLWDYRPLRDTYEQLQALRPYYQFGELDIDRYEIDGEVRQVMLGAREMDQSQLPSPSWVNRNLEFTHGYGIVMNPVNRITRDGRPEFFIQDLPPQSSEEGLEITRPEIYYGEMTNEAVFVGSEREEFSYPSGDENVYSSYEGIGGVPLDNFFKRLAFSIRLADTNVLLSDDINSNTRIQFHRQIVDRVQQITPFLALDDDPYLILSDGRLVWMMDAYTLSDNFPYATPVNTTSFGQFNYIRNAVKITIDAYDGNVTYYVTDNEDPIIRAYRSAFPDLFQDFADMPTGLQKHVRYPEDLFLVQTNQYLTYHMNDVRVFYNKEDLWEIPREIFEGNEQLIEPYYVIMSLPGEEETEFLLIQPYTPASKNNMVAWIAARNDPEHYGELIAYELPKQELVFGPIQVEGRIDQEPSISEQFSLWNQLGSRVIRGNLLVIPMNNSFFYVEPVYLRAETSALPELKRVIVASGSRIGMGTTLDEALASLLEGKPIVTELPDGTTVTTDPLPEVNLDASVEELILSANAHFEAAEAAQRDGDWTTYGRELDLLQQDLQRLTDLTE